MNARLVVTKWMARLRAFRSAYVLSLALDALVIALAMRVFLVLNDPFVHGGLDFDEGHFVWGGWCITKGLVPYRDFLEFKPPFVFLTHALAFKLYGFHEFGWRHFFNWFPLASLVTLQISMRSRGIDRWLSLAVILGIVHLWVNKSYHDVALSDSESIGLTYYWFTVAFLLAKVPFRKVTNALGGATLVMCVLSKEPFLPVALLTWFVAFLVGDRSDKPVRDFKRHVKETFVGGAFVVVALLVYMVPTGALREYFKMVHGYFRFYRDDTQSYCVVLGRFHPTTRFNDLARQYQRARDEFLNRATLGFLIPLGVGSIVFTARRSMLLLATVTLAAVFSLYAVTASNCQWMHYYNMTMSGLFLFIIVGVDSLVPTVRLADWPLRNFIRFGMLATVFIVIRPRYLDMVADYGTRKWPNEYVEPVPGVFEAVNTYTKRTDRIFTTGMPSFYVQADRVSAVRESAIVDEALGYYDGNTDVEKLSGLRAQLEKHMPKLVITDPQFGNRKNRTNAALIMPFLGAHHYKEVGSNIWLRPD